MQYLLTIIAFVFAHYTFAQRATLIVHNARVVTLTEAQPSAQALAVEGDRILAVGDNATILKLKGKNTRVIDAGGKTVIPGLFDSHIHVIRAGRFYNTELRWDGVKTLARALAMLKEQAARTPEGQWVRVVGGWNEYQFEEKRLPTLEEINNATGNTPAFILYLYGHAYLNKSGLDKLKIDGTTPNPPGGLIQKDPQGNPTGLLVAEPNAFILYSTLAKLPELTAAEKINSTRLYMTELNRLGVTSVMDAGGGFQNFPDDYKITDSLKKVNQLTVRLPYYLFAQKGGTELKDYQRWIEMIDIEEQHMEDVPTEYFVQGGGENLVASGADFENFNKPRPELSPVMEKQLKDVITLLVKNRWPFRIHATYNESITRFLNVIEEVNQTYPLDGIHWLIDHAETITEQNLQRIKLLNGGVAIQDRMAFQGESFISRYGKQAALNTPPIGKMIASGIRLGAGTDGTRVSSYNPWVSIYWLVSGKTVGGIKTLSDENVVDRTTALKLFTQGSASLIGMEKDRGVLRKGAVADLAILNHDILSVDEERIKATHALLTVLDGKIVYGERDYADVAPEIPDAIPAWSPVNFYGGYQYK